MGATTLLADPCAGGGGEAGGGVGSGEVDGAAGAETLSEPPQPARTQAQASARRSGRIIVAFGKPRQCIGRSAPSASAFFMSDRPPLGRSTGDRRPAADLGPSHAPRGRSTSSASRILLARRSCQFFCRSGTQMANRCVLTRRRRPVPRRQRFNLLTIEGKSYGKDIQ